MSSNVLYIHILSCLYNTYAVPYFIFRKHIFSTIYLMEKIFNDPCLTFKNMKSSKPLKTMLLIQLIY